MKTKTRPMRMTAAALFAATCAICVPAGGADQAPSHKDLAAARADLERAREDLRKAAEQLAEVYAESKDGSPRAAALRYYANPRRGFLGVNIEEGPEIDGLQHGVLVSGVTPGSGADRAGIRSGDLLVAANGQTLVLKPDEGIDPMHKLKEVMTGTEVGSEVKIDYERAGKKKQVTVIASRPPDDALAMMSPEDFDLELDDDGEDADVLMFRVPSPPGAPAPPLPPGFNPDLQLAKLDEDLSSYFRTDEGVLVVKAPKNDALGLKGGDVIQEINGEDVDSPVEVMERLTETAPGSAVTMKVMRHGRAETLKGTAPEASRRVIIKRHKIEVPEPARP